MTLKTRKPTGAVPWPLILIEGGEKTGKSWSSAALSASDKVGRVFWIDLGEGSADEYGAIPGAEYEIVEHDGSFAGLYSAVAEIRDLAEAELKAGRTPVVLVIDSMTAEWDLLKDWATDRARSSKGNRAKLAQDPHAEIRVSTNYWNDANSRHRKLMRLLMTFPGIAVMTARGKDVAAIGEDGQPVEGKKEYRVEAQKSLGSDASCWVRLSRDHAPIVVGARSVHAGIRPGIDPPRELPADWTLQWLIFDALKCDPAKAHVRDLVEPKPDAITPEQIRDEALRPETEFGRIKELYALAEQSGYDGVTIFNEIQAEELLLAFLHRIGGDKRQAKAAPGDAAAPDAAAAPEKPAVTDEDWYGQAVGRVLNLATIGEVKGLWGESASMVKAGKCTTADAAKLQEMLSARAEELKQPAAPAADALADDDPWTVKIRDMASPEDAEDVRAELAQAFADTPGDDPRVIALFGAWDDRVSELTRRAAA